MAARRTAVIGMELGDGPLLHAWAMSGELPYLKKLIETGSFGWLDTSADQLHISAWPSIYTGVEPGEHGVYFTFQPAPGLQGYRRFHTGLYGKPTFWKVLDEAGVRCAVLDAPYTHGEEGYQGAFINDWGTWAHYLQPGSVPPPLLGQLQSAIGAYPLGMEANDLGFEPLDAHAISDKLVESIERKTAATLWLMSRDSSQVLVTVFGETHVAGHYCWPAGAQEIEQVLGYEPMRKVYKALDNAVRQIHAALGEEGVLMVVSGDRVGPNHAGCHLLPEILTRLGYLARPAPNSANTGARPKFDPVKFVRDLMPVGLRKWIARQLPTSLRDNLAQRVDTADIDWTHTRAYWLPTDLEGCIRVNLAGREPMGIVQRGAEYEALLDEMESALRELRDPATGESIVNAVIRTDQRFPGPKRDWLPDLIVQWRSGAVITGAMSQRVGSITEPNPDPRPGTHRGPGFVLAQGPGIARGATLQQASILDIAPTVLSWWNVTVPAYMPGHALPELTSRS